MALEKIKEIFMTQMTQC